MTFSSSVSERKRFIVMYVDYVHGQLSFYCEASCWRGGQDFGGTFTGFSPSVSSATITW